MKKRPRKKFDKKIWKEVVERNLSYRETYWRKRIKLK